MPIGVPSVNNEGQWTFLEICQRVVRECGIAHSATLLPRTVLDQVGEMRRIVDWSAEAWFDIQQLHPNWRFKRREATFATIDGQAEYTYQDCGIDAGTFGRWVTDSFRIYRTSAGFGSEIPVSWLPYDTWRNTYKIGNLRTVKSQPIQATVLPNDGIGLGPVPLSDYTFVGDYYTAPIRMEADEDVPELPFKHSPMIIVYKAMISYALYESAPEVLSRAQLGFKELLTKLETDQLPELLLAGALA